MTAVFPHLVAIDLTPLSSKELSWLLHEKVIALPALVRNLLALQNGGVEEVLIQYRLEQDIVRKTLAKHSFLNHFITWFPSTKSKPMSTELINNLSEKGGFWLHPNFLVNQNFLHAFERALQQNPTVAFAKNSISKQYGYWLSKTFFEDFFQEGGGDFQSYLKSKSAQEVQISDPHAKGLMVKNLDDVLKAEELLADHLGSGEAGLLDRTIHEPIRFWLAKHLATSYLPPDTYAILATLLGVLSACLVFYAGEESLYWPYQVAAVLFYLGEILSGTEQKIFQLTARKCPLSKRYAKLTHAAWIVLFLIACTRAAYRQSFHPNTALLAILATAAITLASISYLLHFTAKRYGKASLRLYEARFLQETAQDHLATWVYFRLKKTFTLDVLVAALSTTVFFCQPGLIPSTIALLIVLAFITLLYFGKHYAPKPTAVAA